VSVIECALAPIAVAPSAVTTIMEGATPAVGGFEIDLHARVGVILWRSAAAGSFLCWQSHASSKDIVACASRKLVDRRCGCTCHTRWHYHCRWERRIIHKIRCNERQRRRSILGQRRWCHRAYCWRWRSDSECMHRRTCEILIRFARTRPAYFVVDRLTGLDRNR
jgi:hypothetical protein